MGVISQAILLAARGHRRDTWGEFPYLTHLALVADRVQKFPGAREQTVVVAWLHDLFEDHPDYADEIRETFPNYWPALRLLARDDGVPYRDYVNSVVASGNRDAILVKHADLLVNLENRPPDARLTERYQDALRLTGPAVATFETNGWVP